MQITLDLADWGLVLSCIQHTIDNANQNEFDNIILNQFETISPNDLETIKEAIAEQLPEYD